MVSVSNHAFSTRSTVKSVFTGSSAVRAPGRGAPEEHREIARAERGAVGQEPGPRALHVVEHSGAAEPREAELVAQAAPDLVADLAARVEVPARLGHALAERRHPRRR